MNLLETLTTEQLVPVVQSITVAHLSTVRDPWSVRSDARAWTAETSLDDVGAGLDSLGLVTLANDVSRRFLIHEVGIDDYLLARRRFTDWGELIREGWRRMDTPRILFETSGSSGTPTRVVHPLSALAAEIEAFQSILPAPRRIVSYVDPHHIYGFLFSVLFPAMAGLPVERRHLSPIHLSVEPRDCVVSFPDHWRLIADRGVAPGADVHGLSSTAPLPADLAARLREAGVRLTEVYGSTETAGVGYRRETGAPYTLLPLWERRPDDPPEVIRRREGAYGEGPVSLLDHIEWIDAEHFHPRGRRDDVIQIAGTNVSPAQVAATIQRHPAVRHCVVRPFSTGGGLRLKAFVVAETTVADGAVLRRELDGWARAHLRSPERPVSYALGDALPRTPMGKPADWPDPEIVDADRT